MAEWKKNPAVGVVAGVILVLAIVVLLKVMVVKPKPLAETKNLFEIPANLPYIKK